MSKGKGIVEIGSLQIIDDSGRRVFACECGHLLCSVKENFKAHALKRDRPLTEMQPQRLNARASDQFLMREYICPKCGTIFEVDVVLKEKPEDIPTMQLR
jgi:acetone carboxylase gamma subunit